jgi:molecular chaperone GrpE
LTCIDAINSDFDPEIHEAVAKTPATDEQKGKVVDVIQKGYSLHDKLIRHPKVIVGE